MTPEEAIPEIIEETESEGKEQVRNETEENTAPQQVDIPIRDEAIEPSPTPETVEELVEEEEVSPVPSLESQVEPDEGNEEFSPEPKATEEPTSEEPKPEEETPPQLEQSLTEDDRTMETFVKLSPQQLEEIIQRINEQTKIQE